MKSTTDQSTMEIYDDTAQQWQRNQPVILSDYTARPFILDLCETIKDRNILDLGCGEGYVTRQLKARGASHIEGIDISEQMIEIARSYEEKDSLVINYSTGSATDLSYLGGTTFDLVIAVFLFNYLTVEEMSSVMQQVFRLLKPNGRFIFSIPHPSLPFTRPALPPFYFLPENYGYFSGIDRTFEGRIWRRDGTDVPVRCVHKTWEHYFSTLRKAGFTSLPDVHELCVTESHLKLDKTFFGPLLDQPLHVVFRIER